MFNDLKDEGFEITEDHLSRIYGPVGLDIGAETSEEIALSVLAEIKAVLNNTPGSFLRDKKDVIHSRAQSKLSVGEESKKQKIMVLPDEDSSVSCGIGPM